MKSQFDPQEMIDEMISIIGADDGKYRNVWSRRPRGLGRSSTANRRRGVQDTARSSHSDSRTDQPPRSRKEPLQ
jgi:hypothetical protein